MSETPVCPKDAVLDDQVIVDAWIEELRDDSFYTNADRVAGAMVIEADKDDEGRLYAFMVLGGKAQEVKLDLSRLAEGLVVAEAA